MEFEPEVSVVLPTLNEREAFERLHPRLLVGTASFRSEVIVVDDASTDGTVELVESLSGSGRYRLIERRDRRGLASAVVDGIRASRGRVVVVLDSDGSHPPEAIPSLVGPILSGAAELVIASRHIAGGSAPGFAWGRRAISWGAALLARPLTPVRDPMSGYFAVAKAVTSRTDLSPVGYKIGLEILVRCRPRPVIEVPIVFSPRSAGASKLGGRQVAGYLRHLGRLYAFVVFRRARASRTR